MREEAKKPDLVDPSDKINIWDIVMNHEITQLKD